MRIIKDNKDDVIICRSCECVYDYETNDLILLPGAGFLICCPKCGQQLILINDELREKELVIEVKGDESC